MNLLSRGLSIEILIENPMKGSQMMTFLECLSFPYVGETVLKVAQDCGSPLNLQTLTDRLCLFCDPPDPASVSASALEFVLALNPKPTHVNS